jgi:hypothetical protein
MKVDLDASSNPAKKLVTSHLSTDHQLEGT